MSSRHNLLNMKGIKGFQKGHGLNKGNKFRRGISPWNKGKHVQLNTGRTHFKNGIRSRNYIEHNIVCAVCEKIFHTKPSNTDAKFCSMQCKKVWESKHMRGDANPNWKGGRTKHSAQRRIDMGRIEYRQWRMSVFQRDGFKCQSCNVIGGDLHAHHIKKWADHPMLRYETDNGVTLCVECHRLTF